MAGKTTKKAGSTYTLSKDSTDNPKLRAKVLSDGRESLFLDYYLGYQNVHDEATDKTKVVKHKKTEYLSLYLVPNPRTPLDRKQNNETLELAKGIRFERGQELLENREGYRLKRERNVNFLEYFEGYISTYKKQDIRNIKVAYNRFKDFLKDTPEYSIYSHSIKPDDISKDMMIAFTEYLQSRSKGEGAKTIYQRFKKVVNHAVDHGVMANNPCKGVSIKVDENILRKDVLSTEEIQLLMATHYPNESTEIRRAFIFCLYTGIRFCDVKELRYSNVDYSNRLLKFEQNKTKGGSASSGVVIPLNSSLLSLIGEPIEAEGIDTCIFHLPSSVACNKALKRWVARAGINKHITWHCARHSFAVNILNNGANIKTVSSLLGHSSLKHTEKYTRAVDKLKEEAINSLPPIQGLE